MSLIVNSTDGVVNSSASLVCARGETGGKMSTAECSPLKSALPRKSLKSTKNEVVKLKILDDIS